MNKPVVGRFAPSPSGYLHMGNLLSLMLAWLDCRSLGGELIFRLEDLDPARSKKEYSEAMISDLRWLGLDWDRGYPEEPQYAQSARTELYEAAFETLRRRDLAYPCWCTRAQRLAAASAPHPGERDRDPGCPCAGLTREERRERLASGKAPAWKLRCPDEKVRLLDGHYGPVEQNLRRDAGDFILRRADGVFAYQLAVSVDDAVMGVTRVVRGRDLLASAPRQKWLIETLGYPAPDYCHGPLLTDGEGKLSKRLGSLSTQVLRGQHRPEEILGRLAFLAGLIDREEPVTARDLLPDFSWEKVRREDVRLEAPGGSANK